MKRLVFSLGILLGSCISTQLMAKNYYVNTLGKDTWSGTLKAPNANQTDGPFKTLEKAKAAIRALKQANQLTEPTTVNIGSGTYYLSTPLSFSLLDSGLAGKEITWQGETGATVIVSGGIPVACTQGVGLVWECPLTQLPLNTTFFDTTRIKGGAPRFEFFVDGQRLQLARWPDQGWAHIKAPLDSSTKFSVMESLPTSLNGSIKSAQVHIFPGNDWYDQYAGIYSVSLSSNSIQLTSATTYPLASGRRFYIRNLPALLDAPGEWVYDSVNKKIRFIPSAQTLPANIMVSSLPNLLIGDGLSYVNFKNIKFQYSAGTGIMLKNSQNLGLAQLEISNVGGKGLDIKVGKNIQLTNSAIHHTGAHGIDSSGGDRSTLQASGIVIHNNHIHDVGQVLMAFTPAVNLTGAGTKVTHNLLEKGPVTGLWVQGNNNLIEKNEIHDFCIQASDCGAVYSGRDWSSRGNMIRYNHIYNLVGYGMTKLDLANNQVTYSSPDGAIGIYLDDGASGFEITGNIIQKVGFIALQIGGGRDNKVTNNYFRTANHVIWQDDRDPTYDWSQNQASLTNSPYKTAIWQQAYPELAVPMNNYKWPEGNRIERNVIVSDTATGNSFRYYVPVTSTVISDNLVWSTKNNLKVRYKLLEANKLVQDATWNQWVAEGVDHDTYMVDPCVTITGNKMTTCNSAVSQIGFTPLPADIGMLP